MDLSVFQIIVINSISGMLSVLLLIFAFVRREKFAFKKAFIFMMIFSVFYIFGHVFELASNSVEEAMFWIKFQYMGLAFLAPTNLVVVMQFTGQERFIKGKKMFFFYLVPLMTLFLCWTNEWHHLFYQSVYSYPDIDKILIEFDIGPWYIVHGCYTFGSLFLGASMLIWYGMQTKMVYWKSIIPMAAALITPMIASFLYLMGFTPYGVDPVPSVMFLTSIMYFYALTSSRYFQLVPIARNRIFESMTDGVVVLNSLKQISDYNSSATLLLEKLSSTSIGKHINEVCGELCENIKLEDGEECIFELCLKNKIYQVKITPLMKNKNVQVGYTIIFSDITSQKQIEERLKYLAYMDGLTGIYNRTRFLEKSQAYINKSLESNTPISLIIFDVDNFKTINDTYGHIIGDAAIRHVANKMKKYLSSEAIFGRFGGEEFIICLPGKKLQEAFEIAETLRLKLISKPLKEGEINHVITASFGVAEFQPHSDTLTTLIQRADRALYQSKENGKNQVSIQSTSDLVPSP